MVEERARRPSLTTCKLEGVLCMQCAPVVTPLDVKGIGSGPMLSPRPSIQPPTHAHTLSASAQSALTSMWQSAHSPTPSVNDRSSDLLASYQPGGRSAGSLGTSRPMLPAMDRYPSGRSLGRSFGENCSVMSAARAASVQGRCVWSTKATAIAQTPSQHF
jgi:hypothetical protein